MILARCGFLILVLMGFLVVPANASCAKKNAEINQMISRLADFSSSTDPSQQTRDKEAIRKLVSPMDDEDCVNATAEMQRLHDLLLTVSNSIDVLADYGLSDSEERDRYLSLTPIQLQVYYANDKSESAFCRCYARRETVESILMEMSSMLSAYAAPVQMSPREYSAVFAWYKIMDGYLSDVIGVHVANLKQITGSDLGRIRNIADSALRKHCGLTLYGTVNEPAYGECKYKAHAQTPAPTPVETH